MTGATAVAPSCPEIASQGDAEVGHTVEIVFSALLDHILADTGPDGPLGFERYEPDQWAGLMSSGAIHSAGSTR
jgi:hypothetical protein